MSLKPNGTPGVSRVTRSREEARTSYNRLSGWYDLIAGGSERRFREKGLEMLNALEGEMVLEVGCGTGHSLLALSQEVGKSGQVLGIDLSEGMLGQTCRRISQSESGNRVSLQCGDAVHLPYREGSFDAVFMSFTLELFDTLELPLVMNECWRVLNRNGRMGIVSLAKEKRKAVNLYEWFHRKFPSAIDCRPIYAGVVLKESGFDISESTRLAMWGLPVDVLVARKA